MTVPVIDGHVPSVALRLMTKGNNTNTYGTIPVWTATNWEMSFDMVFPTTVSARYMFDGPDVTNRFFISTDALGKFGFASTGVVVRYDDTVITDASTVHPLDGLIHSMRIVGTARPTRIGTLLASYAPSSFAAMGILNLRLTDLDDSDNKRYYPMNEDSSSAIFLDVLNGQNGTWFNRTTANLVSVPLNSVQQAKTVSYTDTAGVTGAWPAGYCEVMIYTTTAAYVEIGEGVTATVTSTPIPANMPTIFKIPPGTGAPWRVSAVQISTGGILYAKPVNVE